MNKLILWFILLYEWNYFLLFCDLIILMLFWEDGIYYE